MKRTFPERYEYLEVTEVGDELFVFSPKENQAYSLNPTAAKLFGWCDGKTSVPEMEQRLGGDEQARDLVHLTLGTLASQGLIAMDEGGLNRREFLQKWGAAVAALPVVTSVFVPKAARAASATTTTSTTEEATTTEESTTTTEPP
ncbi:MAG: PqqD family protein [Vulcanimicrobiota bacterium]